MLRRQQDELACPHFALIYIDRGGNLRHETSPSIANSRETILSIQFTDAFLGAVAQATDIILSHSRCKYHILQENLFHELRQSSSAWTISITSPSHIEFKCLSAVTNHPSASKRGDPGITIAFTSPRSPKSSDLTS